jgi:hypothetical protein
MTEKFLEGQKAGRNWRQSASEDELQRVRMAAESMGKRGSPMQPGVKQARQMLTRSNSIWALRSEHLWASLKQRTSGARRSRWPPKRISDLALRARSRQCPSPPAARCSP